MKVEGNASRMTTKINLIRRYDFYHKNLKKDVLPKNFKNTLLLKYVFQNFLFEKVS